METALGWFGDLFRAILKIFPIIVIVRDTHSGVKFKYGSKVVSMQPDNGVWGISFVWSWWFLKFERTGLHIVWPLVTEYEVIPVRRQTVNLDGQYLSTNDRKKVGVGGIVVYEIKNAEMLLTQCHDYDETIMDITLAEIKSVITSHTLEHLLKSVKDIDKELTQSAGKELRRFGIRVIKCTLSDLVECRMIALWQ